MSKAYFDYQLLPPVLIAVVVTGLISQPSPAQYSSQPAPLPGASMVTNEAARLDWQRQYADGQKALEQGNYQQAELLLRPALSKAEEIGLAGPVAMTMYNLGKSYQSQGKNAEAEDMYKKALDIYDNSMRRSNKGILQSLIKDYAKLLRDANRLQEAIELEARIKTPTSIQNSISP